MRMALLFLWSLVISCVATAQDSLRGSNGPFRQNWNVLHYDLNLDFDLAQKGISGVCEMTFVSYERSGDPLQIDLQPPLVLDSVRWQGKHRVEAGLNAKVGILEEFNESVSFTNDLVGVYYLRLPRYLQWANVYTIRMYYHGIPKQAQNPPWDGGFVWKKDKNGKPWVAVAVQGDGASTWFPCKDFQADEPDSGATIRIRNSENLPVISNGQLISGTLTDNPVWQVKSAINPYNITFYIGDYVGWTGTFDGISGKLPLSFYCLRGNEEKARKQFAVVPQMLRCFEEKVGPYPFYRDGYKLVEAPYLGMEHQSAVAYGNGYQMGYLGRDRSGTGIGKTFDYIIIHESGHEWFGNSITAADVADNWIHEGFTTYLESVFVECNSGKRDALKYLLGERQNISNDRPIIGEYGVLDEGSGDRYDKGATIVGMLRAMHPDDGLFWQNFRKMYARFAHQTVTTAQIESFWSEALGRDLKPFFDQYLRTTDIPKLEFRKSNGQKEVRLVNAVKNFSLPLFYTFLRKTDPASGEHVFEVTGDWQPLPKQTGPAPREAFLVEQ